MKKKNGFTLVELLAVIVVLALIMIIAIPSVLDTMNSARRNSFVLYIQKIVKDTQTTYVSDSQTSIPGAGVFIYDIATDLGYTSHGNYKGYVLVDARNVDSPEYVVYLQDPNYMVLGFPVTTNGAFPTADQVQAYNATEAAKVMGDIVNVCEDWVEEGVQCMNRKNFVLSRQ